jgi:hypothetical protein
LSFDLLSRLSRLGLVRGLTKLKFQKDLVCALGRHGKMVAASHPPLTSVMIERPCKMFHMDLVGPSRVCSAGGKWYILYARVFFLADKGETFGFVRDLILRLKNEGMEMLFELFVAVVWTSLGPLPWWVPGPTTWWAPGTTRLVPHGTCWHEAQGLRWRSTRIGSYTYHVLCRGLLDVHD